MRKIFTGILILLAVGCIGSRLYFTDSERYDIKISMIKIDKNYETIKAYSKGAEISKQNVLKAVTNIEKELNMLINKKPSKNPTVYLEHLKEVKGILGFVKDSAKDGSVERTRYHFKRLRSSCMSCHIRYRVGINL